MEESKDENKIPLIYSAICGVMGDMGAVGKDSYNQQQKFKYRSIDAVMNALKPAMTKNKIFCTPEVIEHHRGERVTKSGGNSNYSICKIRYRFYATDGSFVEATVVSEGMDAGDKATNKALSAGFKYACFQVFCIPTEELMDEPDASAPELEEGLPINQPQLITKEMINDLLSEMERTGVGEEDILKSVKKPSLEKITVSQYEKLMKRLSITQTKAQPIPSDYSPEAPDNDGEGLPFK